MISRGKMNEFEDVIKNDKRFIDLHNEIKLYEGSEVGHTFGSKVEDLITRIMTEKYGCTSTKNQSKTAKKGKGARSLGDLVYNGIELINVKTGDENMGQPNMCSMNRILEEFICKQTIDSYTIIKYKIINGELSVNIFDMFDVIDSLTWNSGTGQIMLKESEFYKKYDKNADKISLKEKKEKLALMYEVGIDKHINLRIKQKEDTMKKLRNQIN